MLKIIISVNFFLNHFHSKTPVILTCPFNMGAKLVYIPYIRSCIFNWESIFLKNLIFGSEKNKKKVFLRGIQNNFGGS